MFPTLAQSQIETVTQHVINLFRRVDSLAHPEEFLTDVEQLPIVLSAIMVALGMAFMLQGFRLYKGVIIGTAFVIGLGVGHQLGQKVESALIVAVCLGVLLAVIAWPLMKYAVAAAGGLAGAYVGAGAWTGIATAMNSHGFNLDVNMPWIGALVGLLLIGFMAFILFELTVVTFTSLSGSFLAVIGTIGLLLQVDAWRGPVSDAIVRQPIILPMLILVPAIVALVFQQQIGALHRTRVPGAPAGDED